MEKTFPPIKGQSSTLASGGGIFNSLFSIRSISSPTLSVIELTNKKDGIINPVIATNESLFNTLINLDGCTTNIISIIDFNNIKNDYETIMKKYAGNFKWCDSDDTKIQEQPEQQ